MPLYFEQLLQLMLECPDTYELQKKTMALVYPYQMLTLFQFYSGTKLLLSYFL